MCKKKRHFPSKCSCIVHFLLLFPIIVETFNSIHTPSSILYYNILPFIKKNNLLFSHILQLTNGPGGEKHWNILHLLAKFMDLCYWALSWTKSTTLPRMWVQIPAVLFLVAMALTLCAFSVSVYICLCVCVSVQSWLDLLLVVLSPVSLSHSLTLSFPFCLAQLHPHAEATAESLALNTVTTRAALGFHKAALIDGFIRTA